MKRTPEEIKKIKENYNNSPRVVARKELQNSLTNMNHVLNELKKRDDLDIDIKKKQIYELVFEILCMVGDEEVLLIISNELHKYATTLAKLHSIK